MNRVALIGMMVEDTECSKQINEILHQYNQYIIGRMGIPNVKDDLNIISVALDAPSDVMSAISGKLGRINGVTAKMIYSKLNDKEE
ncbi:MAG: iron-only hydrogenase system regulator [Oscillospiraceae bacterium]|nr:iron-only hydrogenase system regulator [Oscillospiraceae bacterium]